MAEEQMSPFQLIIEKSNDSEQIKLTINPNEKRTFTGLKPPLEERIRNRIKYVLENIKNCLKWEIQGNQENQNNQEKQKKQEIFQKWSGFLEIQYTKVNNSEIYIFTIPKQKETYEEKKRRRKSR